ncbi:RIP metalloprotease RseP [Ferruginibacter albus]|uniref:RIP metalloprotease RseP n=1 Tax=Ferruginibacter albus TaxID=2875540 RepID=UPI001CC4A4D2|nr:RIP metalloprotease RseP [Ferruginibacter albus]UAY51257.1 RIP metalloprotease RseP [Ferruginibacter albus]
MTLLAINWGNAGMQIFYLVLSLSILVILHEFGHYITARWFKCRVEKFYLFFNPWFSLVKKKIGETEYGIGWLPLGGYVKIAGMIDESMDKEAMKLPPKDYEFRSKPAWQRLIIMLGGIIVNVLLAFVIYSMVLFIWGETKTINSSVAGIWCVDPIMTDSVGLKNGDKVLAVDGKKIEYFEDITKAVLFNGGSTIEVNRNGVDTTIKIPVRILGQLVDRKHSKSALLMPRVPAIVGEFNKEDSSNAKKAGLQHWDKIVKVDSVSMQFMDQIPTYLNNKRNQAVILTVERNKQLINLPAVVNADGRLGIPPLTQMQYDSLKAFKLHIYKPGFFESIPAGFNAAIASLTDYVYQFKLMFNPKTEAYKSLGGFKSIGSVFPTTWGDWEAFWRITGFLSIALAFMNLLPIPALDGGHVVFTLVEMITRRKPSEKFLEYAQIVGMILLFGLMIYANGNDWFGWGRGH